MTAWTRVQYNTCHHSGAASFIRLITALGCHADDCITILSTSS